MLITIKNDIKFLGSVFNQITAYCNSCGFTVTSKLNLNLIVEEYITNSILHGSVHAEEHLIHINLHTAQQRVFVEITDEGLPFNPLEAQLPDLEHKMQNKIPGGLGLLLIREKADDIAYNRINNQNIFKFSLNTNE